MSTYISDAINPKTKNKQAALFIDDYFGHHQYAVAFRKDGKDSEIMDEVSKETHEIYRKEEVEEKQ